MKKNDFVKNRISALFQTDGLGFIIRVGREN
jgi:hypothetical protein